MKFYVNGVEKVAKWEDLKKLHEFEKETPIAKLSRLNDVAVAPKPIERQNVAHCLRVFCDETIVALKSNKNIGNVDDTAEFISIFVKFFKVVNVKLRGEDCRLKDGDRKVISSADDSHLSYLFEIADIVERMETEKKERESSN